MSSLPTKFSVASRVSSKQQSQLENMKLIIVSILLFAFVGSSLAGTHVAAEYGSCQENEYKDLGCTINSVTVEGCRKDRNSKACKVKRNVNAAININFVPDFDGEDITMMAYAVMPMIEKAFPDMDPNACNYTTCPVENGVAQTYSFGLKMAPTYPLGLFNVRFLLKQGDQAKCCFMTKFRIEK